jgi:hypothetical protein
MTVLLLATREAQAIKITLFTDRDTFVQRATEFDNVKTAGTQESPRPADQSKRGHPPSVTVAQQPGEKPFPLDRLFQEGHLDRTCFGVADRSRLRRIVCAFRPM